MLGARTLRVRDSMHNVPGKAGITCLGSRSALEFHGIRVGGRAYSGLRLTVDVSVRDLAICTIC